MKAFRELEVKVVQHHDSVGIVNANDVANLFREWRQDDIVESFSVCLTDGRNRPISWYVVSRGTQTASLVHPREVFTIAVREAACSIILIHNHPSGNPSPSKEDEAVTRRLASAGVIIGIRVMDHLIVGKHGHYSFAAQRPSDLISGLPEGSMP